MRSPGLLLTLLCLFAALAAAWTKEDHEIFRLRDEVEASEGTGVTFYEFLGVSQSATQDEINRAYRQKSKKIHPDKARQSYIAEYAKKHASPSKSGSKKKPGVTVTKNKKPSQKELKDFIKHASDRYSRLTVVTDILRGADRDRYDHFLKNGFPMWRGTGYYYERVRPGAGSVVVGLFLVVGGAAHYGAMVLSYKRQRDFVERYIRHARRMAWGDDSGIQGIPGVSSGGNTTGGTGFEDMVQQDDQAVTLNRRQRRMESRESKKGRNGKAAKAAKTSGVSTPTDARITPGPIGTKKRVIAENGKVLIVDSVGNVYLEEETEEGDTYEFLLDVDEIPKPTFADTAVVKLPKWIFNKSFGRFFKKADVPDLSDEEVDDAAGEDATLQGATAPNTNGEARKRRAKPKAVR